MRLFLCLAFALGCHQNPPKVASVSPKTLCANVENKLMLMGSDLDPQKVEIGGGIDMGAMGAPRVAASAVSGSGSSATATFAKDSLTPSDVPLDVTVTNKDGQIFVLRGAVTVVPGISLAAVDPQSVWNGADFPASFFGIGMDGVQAVSITDSSGTTTMLTGVAPIDANRVDAVVPKGLAPGMYSITVIDKDGCTASLDKGLVIVADVTVSVCSIDPAFGFNGVDTDVTISATTDGKAGSATCGGKTGTFVSSPRAWLSVAGVLQPLGNVAFVSAGSITATVPKGLTVNNTTPYDLIVQDPDGSVGVLAMAFKVVDQPVPRITSIDPPSLPLNTTKPFKIFGANFRAPVKVEVYVKGGNLIALTGGTVATGGTEIDFASITASAFGLTANSAYVVRVTDTDQGTFSEFSALAVISDSLNLPSWTDVTSTSALPQNTMRAGAAGGQVSPAARYLYVVGGDSGGATPTRYDNTQIAVLDKFGDVARWMTSRYKLPAARTWLQVVGVAAASGAGGHLYAIGGDAGSGAVKTVSRAHILLPSEAPPITKSTVSLGGTLARGAWYYQVSAVLDASDPANPMGETLPSQEVTAHTVDQCKVTLEWTAVPHAASYNIYRTAMVNGTSKTEVLFKSAVTDTSFVDDGSGTPEGGTPLSQGELGVWADVAALNDPRRAEGAALARDPSGAAFLYASGGDGGSGLGFALPGGATVYDTYEYAPLSDDGLTLGAWTRDTTNKLPGPRTRHQSPVGEHTTSPKVNAVDAFVYVVAGWSGSALVDFYSSAKVAAGGALGAWSARTTASASNAFYPALASLIASDQLFAIGGVDATGASQTDAVSVPYATPPAFANNISNDPSLKVNLAGMPVAAYGTLVFSSGHLYLLGGTSGNDGSNALNRLWTVVY
jgi:hypothetical protein